LTSFLKPDSGVITVGRYNVEESPVEVRKIIGYLPESAPVYGDMIVYDYLSFIAAVRGIADRRRIADIGDQCGINEVMHMDIGQLSKGYRQRVGLAQSMIHNPDILVLDEPTSGLDPNQIIEIRNLIKEVGKKKTVILSTHILPEVEATCDRVIIIDRGNIVADDSTEHLQADSGGRKRVVLKIAGTDYQTLSGELGRMAGVVKVEDLNEGGLVAARVTSEGTEDIRPSIFKMVSSRNWILYELAQEQRSLERVFRELTGGAQ
jgi:ABC-2 type transport system ATP-binding protein